MFHNTKVTKKLANKIGRAADEAIDSYHARLVEQEPQITDRFLAVCQHSINRLRIGGVQWSAKTFSDRGNNSQEKRYGADFLCSFSMALPTFSVSKGFLAQAKRVEPSDSFSSKDYSDMKEQCEKMLSLSASSFVFLYSRQAGVTVIPAISVVSARTCNPHELTSKGVSAFFVDHFECFVGDRNIVIRSPSGVDGLLEELNARRGLEIVGHGEES
ncbi:MULTISPECIES: hypothetical protein [unclassified Rhodanobacter]|uniref:Restriction endonuclease n=1 Tax=Rhodanobacter humi TaxID=1888173 RepID=A0ABV4ANV6_9GAMM